MNEAKTVRVRTRKKFIFSVVAVLFVFVVVVAVSSRNDEPVYEGRKLSEWLDDSRKYADPSSQLEAELGERANQAVLAIGTNAVPFLLEWIQYQDSTARKMITGWVRRVNLEFARDLSNESKHFMRGLEGFSILGNQAVIAKPDLENALTNPNLRTGLIRMALYLIERIEVSSKPSLDGNGLNREELQEGVLSDTTND